MLEDWERRLAKHISTSQMGNPTVKHPGEKIVAPSPGAPRKMRVLIPDFKLRGWPVALGEEIEVNASDAFNLSMQGRAEYL